MSGNGKVLELEDVVKHYRDGGEVVKAIDGVSLSVGWGEMVSVHGVSGSGKSTLLALIGKLLEPDSGVVRYMGRSLASFGEEDSSRYLRCELGVVHQHTRLMPRVSVLENAAVKLWLDGVSVGQAKERAKPWLGRLGLGDQLDRAVEQLSGGQRQRVAIARALASEPRLIVADEPTSSLDSGTSSEIGELLRRIANERGVSVVLATDDLAIAELADRSFELRDGRLRENR